MFARIGAIALNAVHDAATCRRRRRRVRPGRPGLLVTQLLGLAGATVDRRRRHPRRLELAERFGADHVVDFTVDPPAELIKDLTAGRGADVSIEISGSYGALHEAIRATAYNSRVVVSGFPQGEATGLFLGEEFHHNRIAVVCSQISGVSPEVDHRWNVPRLERTVVELAAAGRLDVTSLVTHTFPAADVAASLRPARRVAGEPVQVVLDFTEAGQR